MKSLYLVRTAQQLLGHTTSSRFCTTTTRVVTEHPKRNSSRLGAVRLLISLILLLVMQGMAWGLDTGLKSPIAGADVNGMGDYANAFKSDDQYAVFGAQSYAATYKTFSLTASDGGGIIPIGATINGIQVQLEGNDGESSGYRDLDISLTWNNGTNYTSPIRMTQFDNSNDEIQIVGGSTILWGHTWTESELRNTNFGIQCYVPNSANNDINIDHIQVRVYYSPTPRSTGITTFDYTGSTQTFTVPNCVNNLTVEAWGGGGGGGNNNNMYSNSNGGTGGGGGGYSKGVHTVIPGDTYYISVGSGGDGAPAYSQNDAIGGILSWFNATPNTNSAPSTNAVGTLANGGGKGNDNSTITPSNAAAVGLGNVNATAGNNGSAGTSIGGGNGGNAANGGPGGIADSGNGNSPGGGGAGSNDNRNSAGGSGGNGRVIVTYTLPGNPTITLNSTSTAACYSASAQNATIAYSAITDCPDKYSIDFVSGITDVTDATLPGSPITIAIPAGLAAGNYTGTLTVKNSNHNFISGSYTITVTVEATPVAGTLAKTPGATTVCAGTNVSASLTGDSGGNGTNETQYRFDGGAWASYTSGTNLTTTGHTSIEIRTRRLASVCSASGYNTVSWNIEATPVAGALAKTPNTAGVCIGTNVSASLTAGSGGNGTDELQSRTNDGSTWSSWVTYTSGDNISTTGKTAVEIQTRRLVAVCTASGYATVIWTVNPLPIMTNSNAIPICSGSSVGLELTSTLPSTYSWVAEENTNVTGEKTITQSSYTIDDVLTNPTASAQTVSYTVTPTSTTGGCQGTPQTVILTVNPSPGITTQPGNQSITYSANASFAVAATNATGYQWEEYVGTTWNPITNGGIYSTANTATLTLTKPTVSMSGSKYRCLITGGCGTLYSDGEASLTVAKANQTITVNTASPENATYNTSFTVDATASSGLAVTYSSDAPLTNTLNVFTMTSGTGTGVVKFNQAGDENYIAAPAVTANVVAVKASSTITATGTTTFIYNGSAQGPATSTVTGSSGAVSYSYSGSGSISYGPSATAPTAAGTYQVIATVAEDMNFMGQSSDPLVFNIEKAPTITTVSINGGPFIYTGSAQTPATVSVTGVGGLNLTPAVIYVNNTNAGTATASYTYAGDDNYLGSDDSETFTIGKALPVISLTVGANPTYDGAAHYVTSATVAGVAGANLGAATVVYKQSDIIVADPTSAGAYAVTADFAETANYKAAVQETGTLTIDKANAVISVQPYNVTFDGLPHTSGFTAMGVETPTPVNLADLMHVDATTKTDAGTYTNAGWTFNGNNNYLATSGKVTNSIGKALPVITLTVGANPTYDGLAHYVTSATVAGVAGVDLGAATVVYEQSGFNVADPTNAGAYDVTASYAGNDNYLAAEDQTGTLTIDKALPVITLTVGANPTYDGAAHYVASATVAGVGSESLGNATVIYKQGTTEVAAPTNAGAYDVTASFAGNDNYLAAIQKTGTLTIDKANAVISVLPYSVTYDGNAHTSTFTAVGVESTATNLAALMNVSATTHADGGTYTGDAWTFAGNTNYNTASGTVDNSIGKINAQIAVTGFSGTYNGEAHGATGTAIGLASLDLGSLLHIDATTYSNVPGGSVAWTFDGNESYNAASGSALVTIDKANALISVIPYNVTYDGNEHTSAFTAVGVEAIPANLAALMDVSATTHTLGGSYTGDAWTFTGNENYNPANGTVDNSIGKIDAVIAVTGFSGTYDGELHGAAGTATGLASLDLGSLLHVDATTYTNAPGGSVAWTFAGNDNYNTASGTATVTITKANAVIQVTPYSVAYDGNEHTSVFTAVGVEAIPANLASLMDVSATTHTSGGSYTGDAWTFTGNENYNPANGTVDNSIGKINAQIAVNGFSGTYNGEAHGVVSSTATGLNAEDLASLLHVDATSFTNAPGGSVAWTFAGNESYNASSGNATVSIDKANALINVDPYTVTYDGNAHTSAFTAVGVEAIPANLASLMDVSATMQTNAGTYTDVAWSFDGNNNYLATSGKVTNSIGKATPIITLTVGLNPTYDGAAHYVASATIIGVGSENLGNATVVYRQGTTVVAEPTNAGAYDVTASYAGNDNYKAAVQKTGTLTIDKALPVISLTVGANPTYDGAAHYVTSATVAGVAGADLGAAAVVYQQGATVIAAPTNAGAYEVTADFAETANYQAAVQRIGTLTIDKATPATDLAIAASSVLVGEKLSFSILSGTFKHPVTDISVPGTLSWDNGALIVTALSSYNWTFTPNDLTNYITVNGSIQVGTRAADSYLTKGAELGGDLIAGFTAVFDWGSLNGIGTYFNEISGRYNYYNDGAYLRFTVKNPAGNIVPFDAVFDDMTLQTDPDNETAPVDNIKGTGMGRQMEDWTAVHSNFYTRLQAMNVDKHVFYGVRQSSANPRSVGFAQGEVRDIHMALTPKAGLTGGTYTITAEVVQQAAPYTAGNVFGNIAYTFTVMPTIAGVTVDNTTVCFGSSVNFTANGLVNGVTDFVYSVAIDGGTPVVGNANGIMVAGGTASFPVPEPDPGTYVVKIISATMHGSTTNFETNNTASFTVRPKFTAGSITNMGESISYLGDPAEIGSETPASGGDNTITYEWRADGIAIANTNAATYDPPVGLLKTTTYTRWAKDASCNTNFTKSAGEWTVTISEAAALAWLQGNTTLTGTLANLTATFPASIPEVILSEPYKIKSRMTLSGAPIPSGSTMDIMITVNGGAPVPYATGVTIPASPFWITDLFSGVTPADFDAGYGGRIELYSITIHGAGGNPLALHGEVLVESIISKDGFITNNLLDDISLEWIIPDAVAPALTAVTPAVGAVALNHNETFKLTVDALEAGTLYELEIDHKMAPTLPEFSVYANDANPYGTAAEQAAFVAAGVTVNYNALGQKWTIDFGPGITAAIVDHGGITFYMVIKDAAGNEFGSMSPTTPQNTFAYTVTQDNIAPTLEAVTPAVGAFVRGTKEFSFDFMDANFMEDLELDIFRPGDNLATKIQLTLPANDAAIQTYLTANPAITTTYGVIAASYNADEKKWSLTVNTALKVGGNPVWPDGNTRFYMQAADIAGNQYSDMNNDPQWGGLKVVNYTFDNTAPQLTVTGFTSNGNEMTGSLGSGYILNTTNDPSIDHLVQFNSSTLANEPLAPSYFGLTLMASSVSATDLKAYYAARGIPAPYLDYLNEAADGLKPFVYISGSTIKLVDAAKHDLASTDVDMTIPDNFPLGSYTVSGMIKDLAGNETAVTYTLVVAGDRVRPIITLLGDEDVSICQGLTYIDAGATANDDIDGVITTAIVTANQVNTSIPNTYTITYNVTDAAGNAADQVTRTVTVRSLPTANISGTTTVLKGETAAQITFTGANGGLEYSFTYNVNEGDNQVVTTNGSNSVTVPAPTNNVGTFNYNLISVSDGNGCSQLQSGTATVTVEQHSTYAFSYTVPSQIVFNENTVVPVTFANTVPAGTIGYDNARFSFAASGPGNVTFKATDSNGNPYIAVNSGNWGPAAGFALPKEYSATTQWTLNFSAPGKYTIRFNAFVVGDEAHPFATQEQTITVEQHSTYAFSYSVPSQVLVNENTVVPVTFGTDVLGTIGYDNARFSFGKVTGPGTVSFTATDSNNDSYTFINNGFWGPSSGFPLSASHTATTPWTLNFSAPGVYTIRFNAFVVGDESHPFATQEQTITVEQHSTYAFYSVPSPVLVNENKVVPVTFGTNVLGTIGYDNARFSFAASGPGDVSFTATDSNNNPYTAVNSGFWGPSTGFALPKEYSATTPWTLNFSAPGTYTIRFNAFVVGDEAHPFAFGVETIHVNPTVSVNSPSVCVSEGSSIITATPSPAGSYTYVWTVPAGAENPGSIDHFIASVAGEYRVVITTEDACTANASGVLTINPFPTATISGTQSVCSGGNASLSVALTGTAPWSIKYTNGLSIETVNNIMSSPYVFTVTPLANSTWTVTNVTDGNGCTNTGSGEAKIYFGPITTAPTITVCQNSPIEVPITVKSFSDVKAISLSLKYDASVMTFAGFDDGGIDFDNEFVHDNAIAGGSYHKIIISNEGNFSTMGTDAVLLTLKFNYLHGTTDLEWLDTPQQPQQCEYAYSVPGGPSFETAPFCDTPKENYYINGRVTGFDAIAVGTSTPVNASCFGSSNGSITLGTVSGGTAPYAYSWTKTGDETIIATTADLGSLTAGIYNYSVTDANNCTAATGSVTITQPDAIVLSGTVNYYNTSSTPLSDVTVNLVETGTSIPVFETTTGAGGNYSFGNVCPGNYDVIVTTEVRGNELDAINSTDAGQANSWQVSQYPLGVYSPIEKVRFLAGAVADNNDRINANDASMIQRYFVNEGNISPTFDRPWEFWKANDTKVTSQPQTDNVMHISILPGSGAVTQNFLGLVSGDFDRSYEPIRLNAASLVSKNLSLLKGENKEVLPTTTIDLPIKAGAAMQVGAISLLMEYAAEKLQVEGVFLKDHPDQSVEYSAINGKLRIGWNSMNPLSLAIGETMLTLRLKTTSSVIEGEVIGFKLTPSVLNELADGNFDVIPNASLIMDGLELNKSVTPVIDINDPSSGLLLSCYPNPFRDNASIKYTLPFTGNVSLEVTSILGNRIKIMSNQEQAAGEYITNLQGEKLVPGVYMIILKYECQYGVFTKTIRMIKQ